jgi:mycothiol synthase
LRSRFEQALLDTYAETRDCPALTGIRPIECILAAHQAAGAFHPELWELAVLDQAPVGVLLLTEHLHDRSMEVVYMGVAAAARGRGVGSCLLRRALVQARRKRSRRLSLVVDAQNEPAQRLYRKLGLRCYARRQAWWYRA